MTCPAIPRYSSLNESLPPHVALVAEACDLRLIENPMLNLVIWTREIPVELNAFLSRLQAMRAPLACDWTAPDEALLRADLQSHVRDPVYGPSVAWLAYDIFSLMERYKEISGVLHPRVRLDRVQDGGCVLFHEDFMEMRLLCTYAGPGMQWVANEDVRRSELGLQGRSVREANAAAVPNADRIRSVATGDVAMFKGALHPRKESGALIHRSAPVFGPSEYRIRLCIDDTSDCGC